MKIFVRAKPRAKKEFVKEIGQSLLRAGETYFEVAVKAPPKGGKANEAIAKALAKHFGVAASRVRIISGHSAKQKTLKII